MGASVEEEAGVPHTKQTTTHQTQNATGFQYEDQNRAKLRDHKTFLHFSR
jgi:hypothetical protein